MTIKHLVISGGGPTIIQSLGAIQHLDQNKFIDIKNIESIYGTSAGAVIGTMMCLKYDWETINDYIIKRPWHEVFPIKIQNILDITMLEFYEYSKVELHFFTFELNEFKLEDISYLTHPTLSLIHAIQMTCALPVLMAPICVDKKCYIDGGVVCNYPLKCCIEICKNEDEILGIRNQYDNDDKSLIDSESTLLDFMMGFLFKVIYSLSTDHKQPTIKNEVVCNANLMSFHILKTALSSIDTRRELFKNGEDAAKKFLADLENSV